MWTSFPGGKSKALRAGATGPREAGRHGREWTTIVLQYGHRTVGIWKLPAVRPETKGASGRALNAVSRAEDLAEGAVTEEPAGHRILLKE